jgi:hypothetical protein
MTDWAGPFLEPGETVQLAAWGPSSGIRYVFALASGRIAAVTERHLYVFDSAIWGRMSRPRGVVAKYPIGAVRMRLRGWTLRVGEQRMIVHLHHRGRARRIVGWAAADASRLDPSPVGTQPGS